MAIKTGHLSVEIPRQYTAHQGSAETSSVSIRQADELSRWAN